MRFFLAIVPAVLMAQTPAPQKAPAAATPKPVTAAPKPAAAKPAAAVKPATGAAKPVAAPKPATAAKPAPAKPAAAIALKNDDEKIIYSLGLSIYRSLSQFELTPAEMEIVKRALADAVANKPALEVNEWGPKIQGLATARAARVLDREKVVSKAFLDKAGTEAGAVKTESGIVYKELTPGTGASPKASDTVKVHYKGTLINGTEFDSSYKRNEPAQFALTGVVRCWTEGVQKMKVGGKSKLVCPSDLAYGDRGRPGIPPGATLVFEVELLEIVGGQ